MKDLQNQGIMGRDDLNSLFPNGQETQYIRKNKAMEMLGLSRHNFEKAQRELFYKPLDAVTIEKL